MGFCPSLPPPSLRPLLGPFLPIILPISCLYSNLSVSCTDVPPDPLPFQSPFLPFYSFLFPNSSDNSQANNSRRILQDGFAIPSQKLTLKDDRNLRVSIYHGAVSRKPIFIRFIFILYLYVYIYIYIYI